MYSFKNAACRYEWVYVIKDMNISRSQHKCKLCDQSFKTSYSLEVHVIDVHDKVKLNHCDECEAKFLFKWKLQKHKKIHWDNTLRKCHYYNNGLDCPFVRDGCKFAHETAEKCKFSDMCKKTKCEFRH